jgi:hypothetical protein
MKRTPLRSVPALSLVASSLLVGACGAGTASTSGSDDFSEGAPELAAVELRLTGDAQTEDLATDEDAIDAEAFASDELAQVSSDQESSEVTADLSSARDAVRDLNRALRRFLQPVLALVRETAATKQVGDVKVWGPVTRGATDYRFAIRRRAARRFVWLLDARVAESDTAYSHVGVGELALGEVARRGIGVAGFDLNALGEVDPTVVARGKLLAGFAHGELGTTVGYALEDFTRDPESKAGVDALVQEVHLANEVSRLRLAYRGDVAGTETTAEELVLARVRHSRGRGGRSDAIVTGGDVPGTEAWVISQCWSGDLEQVYRVVRVCPGDGIGGETCTVQSTEGEASACAAGFRTLELPPADANEPMADSEDPNGGVSIPDSMPEVDKDIAEE